MRCVLSLPSSESSPLDLDLVPTVRLLQLRHLDWRAAHLPSDLSQLSPSAPEGHQAMAQLLTISSLTSPRYSPTSPPLWTSLSFSLPPSSILVLRGPSGSGKSVLLKCIAKLLLYPPPGEIRLHGQTACEMGVPEWRSKVLYIPQRAAMLPGTPAEFWTTVTGFRARASRMGKEEIEEGWRDPREIAESWGIGRGAWEQSWGSLSGGEAQRIALAVGVALRPEVLLLDGECRSSLSSSFAWNDLQQEGRVGAKGRDRY